MPDISRKPLKNNHFHILLALSRTDMHGFAIQRDVKEQTDGRLHLWPATLYGSLDQLCERALIQELKDPDDRPTESEKRRYYRITEAGRQVVTAEAERMMALARIAQERTRKEA
jgi:DNA-binding PadR family transcriptional regulator